MDKKREQRGRARGEEEVASEIESRLYIENDGGPE